MAADLTTGLLADWEVGTSNTDLSGNGRNLTTVGSVTRTNGWLIGPNGSNYLTITNPTWLDNRGTRTVLVSARSSSRSGSRCTVSHGGATAATTTNIYVWDSAGIVVYSNNAVRHIPGGNNPPTNSRTAVVAWWQVTTANNRYSINNSPASLANTGNCTVVNPCPALMIGNWPGQPGLGDIKRVSFYDRVLTAEDINAWYDREHEDQTWYFDPNAVGSNTGTSFANAFTALTSVNTNLLSHDSFKLNASSALPFVGGQTFNNIWRINATCDEGSATEYNSTNGRLMSTATGPTAEVFQQTGVAAKPSHVVYDWKQDTDGSVTGWVYDSWDEVLLNRWNVPEADRAISYGYLTENTGTPTTPGEGEWGYSGTTLYINPPGAPDQATVRLKARYVVAGLHGLGFVGCNELSFTGRSRFNLYSSAAGSEYAVFGNGQDSVIEDVIVHDGGWHAVGFAGGSPAGGANNTLRNIIVNGVTGDEAGGAVNGCVFYQPSTATSFGGHVAENIVLIAHPRMLHSGVPVTTNWAAQPCLVHSDVGVTTMTADWDNVLCIDKVRDLETFHGITNNATGYSTLAQGTIGDVFDYETWPQKITNSYWRSRIIPAANGQTAYNNVCFDRYGQGKAALSALSGNVITGTVANVYLKNCFLILDKHANAFFESFGALDSLVLDGCIVLFMSDVSKSTLASYRSAGTGTNRVRFINGCVIDSSDATKQHAILHSSSSDTAWTANFNDISSDGTNVFGANMLMAWNVAKTTSKDIAWWNANIEGGSTDVQRILPWGATEAAKVNYLRQWWLTGSESGSAVERFSLGIGIGT